MLADLQPKASQETTETWLLPEVQTFNDALRVPSLQDFLRSSLTDIPGSLPIVPLDPPSLGIPEFSVVFHQNYTSVQGHHRNNTLLGCKDTFSRDHLCSFPDKHHYLNHISTYHLYGFSKKIYWSLSTRMPIGPLCLPKFKSILASKGNIQDNLLKKFRLAKNWEKMVR